MKLSVFQNLDYVFQSSYGFTMSVEYLVSPWWVYFYEYWLFSLGDFNTSSTFYSLKRCNFNLLWTCLFCLEFFGTLITRWSFLSLCQRSFHLWLYWKFCCVLLLLCFYIQNSKVGCFHGVPELLPNVFVLIFKMYCWPLLSKAFFCFLFLPTYSVSQMIYSI